MADGPISSFIANTTPATTDILTIVDDPGGSPSTQKITLENLLKVMNGLTEDASPDLAADFLLEYDTSAGTVKKVKAENVGGTTSATKGRVEIQAATVPTTVGAPIGQISGGSSPVEGIPYFSFVNGTITYRDFYCRLIDYSGGGLTLNFEVLRTSATAALRYVFEAAIRRINTGTEDITASHTYDYNAVTITIPAGPPAAGIPMLGTITFTDGADMDSLANNEAFILRFRRNATTANDDATDTARVLASITMRET